MSQNDLCILSQNAKDYTERGMGMPSVTVKDPDEVIFHFIFIEDKIYRDIFRYTIKYM